MITIKTSKFMDYQIKQVLDSLKERIQEELSRQRNAPPADENERGKLRFYILALIEQKERLEEKLFDKNASTSKNSIMSSPTKNKRSTPG